MTSKFLHGKKKMLRIWWCRKDIIYFEVILKYLKVNKKNFSGQIFFSNLIILISYESLEY